MATRTDVAKQYVEAQRSRDAGKIDELAALIADDVSMVTPRGNVDGKAALIDRLKNPPQGMGGGGGGGMMGQVTMGDPVEEGGTVKIEMNIPPNPMIQGMAYVFSFNEKDQINKVEMQIKR